MRCSGPLHSSHIADYTHYLCPLSGPDVGHSVLVSVCDVEHTSFNVNLCSACLVSVQVFAPYHSWEHAIVEHLSL